MNKEEQILNQLKVIIDPDLNKDIVSLGFIKKLVINNNNIQLDIHNIDHIQRGEGNRQKYEDETRNIRYTFYKEILNKYNLNGVVLAHHKDDYSENVYNNIMRGSNNITNLGVFKKENLIHEVKVYRPMLEFRKSDIYKISI